MTGGLGAGIRPSLPWFDPALRPVVAMSAALPIRRERGSPVLPPIVLWAFRLNVGDLLTVSHPETDPPCLWLEIYLRTVEVIGRMCSHPWRFIEELLRRPQAAVGPNGALWFPDESLARLPAGALSVHVTRDWPLLTWAFEIRGEASRWAPALFVEARYVLPVLSDFRVVLPVDALWVLGLRGGDRLAGRSSLAQVNFEPVPGHPDEELWDLGPDGSLALPGSWREIAAEWRPIDQVRLTVTLSPMPAFQIAPWTCGLNEEIGP